MPEFMLNDRAAPRSYYRLSDFAKGYVEAMFFTNGDTGEDDEFILNQLGTERLTREAIKYIAADCDKFLSTIMPDGCFLRQWLDRVDGYDDVQAGRDFWFTRQGHGVGYWDRDVGEEHAATMAGLSDVAQAFGEAQVEHYRGWIYHR